MKHLYELTDQMKGLQRLIEDGAMEPDVLQDTMEGLTGDIQVKGAGTLSILANLSASVNAYDTEIKRMQARKKTLQHHHTWLKDYLRDNMSASGITKIESPVFTASLTAPTVIVAIEDESLLPDEFIRVVPETRQPVKADILRALKSGQNVPGCKLSTGKHRLVIR